MSPTVESMTRGREKKRMRVVEWFRLEFFHNIEETFNVLQ